MQEVKRIGSAEPSNSTYHIRRMERIEELNALEEKLQNNEERHVLTDDQQSNVTAQHEGPWLKKSISVNSAVHLCDRCSQKVGQQGHRSRHLQCRGKPP